MQASSILQLAAMGLLVASLPLAMVWMSSDANKYRKLVWVAVFLTFLLKLRHRRPNAFRYRERP